MTMRDDPCLCKECRGGKGVAKAMGVHAGLRRIGPPVRGRHHSSGHISITDRIFIYNRDGHSCRNCGRQDRLLTIDHIVPKAKGGSRERSNLQTMCWDCNNAKGDSIPEEGGE